MKKFLCVGIATLFVFFVVSCSSGKTEETTSTKPVETTQAVETTTELVEYYDEEGRLVLPNANVLMTKLDMGLRVTNIAQNAKFYVIDGNVGMITFDFEGKSYTYKGSKEVKDFSALSGISGAAKNFYLIEASGGTVQGFYTVNQYGEGEEITSTVISWKAYEGTEFEAWYVVVCLKNLSESEVNAIVSRVVGI